LKRIRIYLEGGGDYKEQRAALRQGMCAFLAKLKDEAAERQTLLEVVPCGGRQKAYEAFRNAVDNSVSGILPLLLVDSEGPVTAPPPAHLTASESWAFGDTEGTRVHLMIQAMETWIVADAEAVASYYRQKFVRCLPKADDLEQTPKATVAALLSRATMRTQKGEYHKTRHAPDLLRRLDQAKVRKRCRSCERLFAAVTSLLSSIL